MTTATKKVRWQTVALIGAAVVIILLLMRKMITNSQIVQQGDLDFSMPGLGDINLVNTSYGDSIYNIPGMTVNDLSQYDQQSSCGCQTTPDINIGNNGLVYYAPAKVKQSAPTIVQYQTMVVAPPAPPALFWYVRA